MPLFGYNCICVAFFFLFCGTSKSTQLLPGKNAETVRKRKSQWQQHRPPFNDDISCADQLHTLPPHLSVSVSAFHWLPGDKPTATCGTRGREEKARLMSLSKIHIRNC